MVAPWLSLVLLMLCALPVSAAQADRPLGERERAVHLLSRLTYGPRPGDVEALVEMGTEAWIAEQLTPAENSNADLESLLGRFETLGMTPGEVFKHTRTPDKPGESREEARARRQLRLLPMHEVMQSVTLRACLSSRQLEEVLCDFWRNHLNVSFTKGLRIMPLIPDYEQHVIADNVLGDFPTMLHASAKHPAMLYYLDNRLSRRPLNKQELAEIRRKTKRETGSKKKGLEAESLAAQTGLNENYARELLELHTLGVDNYYKQKDVVAVAEALTGWTVDFSPKGHLQYMFNEQMHVFGGRRVLGQRLSRGRGDSQGVAILDLLSEHKGTAKFIATKLVRYFVNDEPPTGLVNDVAKTYRKTKGDVRAMMRTIIKSNEFWNRENYRAKFKTPYEFVVSAFRATGAEIQNLSVVMTLLENMGQHVYHCDDPTGWYETADAWLDPGVLALRWRFALNLASGRLRGVTIPDSFFDDIPDEATPRETLERLVRKVLPGGAGSRTLSLLQSVVREEGESMSPGRLRRKLLGLLLGCPEFQEQ